MKDYHIFCIQALLGNVHLHLYIYCTLNYSLSEININSNALKLTSHPHLPRNDYECEYSSEYG